MNVGDRMRTRMVRNQVRHIQQHLEAMQRDVHGVEYARWKLEVDDMWKRVFQNIQKMGEESQQSALQLIREPWTMYLTYYAAAGE